jgi:hypothetical protein
MRFLFDQSADYRLIPWLKSLDNVATERNIRVRTF